MKLTVLKYIITLNLFTQVAVASNALTIYVYPPMNEIDWSSPQSTIKSFLGTEVRRLMSPVPLVNVTSENGESSSISRQYKSTMGHSIAHISCESSDGHYDKWSSFSGQNYSEVDKDNLLNKKIGADVLFYDYIDGHIITGEENIKRLIFYKAYRSKPNSFFF